MKKTKLIALTLVVAIMLMGAGYAAWTDTLTVNHTVNTGKLDVDFQDLNKEIFTDNYMSGSVAYPQTNGEYDTAEVTIEKAYPDSEYTVKLRMKNLSTMPVKLDDVSSWVKGGNAVTTITNIVYKINGEIKNENNYEKIQIPVNGFADIELTLKTDNDIKQNAKYVYWIKPIFELYNAN
jgi:predicted ribosomally synthesized peptide with SipW-like signal peptide